MVFDICITILYNDFWYLSICISDWFVYFYQSVSLHPFSCITMVAADTGGGMQFMWEDDILEFNGENYQQWRNLVNLWTKITTIEKEKQGYFLVLLMTGKPVDFVLELSDLSVGNIIAEFDQLYDCDQTECVKCSEDQCIVKLILEAEHEYKDGLGIHSNSYTEKNHFCDCNRKLMPLQEELNASNHEENNKLCMKVPGFDKCSDITDGNVSMHQIEHFGCYDSSTVCMIENQQPWLDYSPTNSPVGNIQVIRNYIDNVPGGKPEVFVEDSFQLFDPGTCFEDQQKCRRHYLLNCLNKTDNQHIKFGSCDINHGNSVKKKAISC